MKILKSRLDNKLKVLFKDIYLYYLYILSIVISLLLIFVFKFEIGAYLLFFLIGLGWSMYFLKKYLRLFEIILLSPAIFVSILTTFSITVMFLGLKVGLFVYGVSFFVSLLFFWKGRIFSELKWDIRLKKWDMLVIILFLILIISKVVSVISFEVPALHDPITHAYFAKDILNKGNVEFFYSPGLHILSALATDLNSFWVGKQILLVTNFFNLYLPFVVYIFLKYISKSKYISVSSAILFAFGYYPSIFFLQAGKNALVACLPILVFFMWLVMFNRDRKDLKLYILSNLVLLSLFIIHYPTAVFGCIFLFSLFLLDFKKNAWSNALNVFGFFPGILWMITRYRYQSELISNSADATVNEVFIKISENLSDTLSYYYTHMIKVSFIDLNSLFIPISILGLIGLIIMIFLGIKKKKIVEYVTFPLTALLSGVITFLIIYLNINRIYIVFETLSIVRFLFLYIGFGFIVGVIMNALSKVISKKFLKWSFMCFVLVVSPVLGYKTYQLFYNMNNERNVVLDSDIGTFEWIDSNIDDNDVILINALTSNGYIYSSDAGGWLGVYTGNEITMPFYDYGSLKTHTNLEYYNRLKNNLRDCEALEYMEENNIDYYYQGSKAVFGPYLSDSGTLQSNGWKLVYSSGNSAIFEIPICQD